MITWCNAQKNNYASTCISKYDEKHNMFILNFDIKKKQIFAKAKLLPKFFSFDQSYM